MDLTNLFPAAGAAIGGYFTGGSAAGMSAGSAAGAGLQSLFSNSGDDANAASWASMMQNQAYNSSMAQQNWNWSADQARIAREFSADFNERMASTQYQRAVKDMQAAGINPMLAYMKGGNDSPTVAANTPSGGTGAAGAVGSWTSPGEIEARIAQIGLSNAMAVSRTMAEVDLMGAQAERERASVPKLGAEAVLAAAQTDTQREQAAYLVQQAKELDEYIRAGGPPARAWEQSARADYATQEAQRLFNYIRYQQWPETLKLRAEALLRQLEIPGAGNQAAWQKEHPYIGGWLPQVQSAAAIVRDAAIAGAAGSAGLRRGGGLGLKAPQTSTTVYGGRNMESFVR